MNSINQYTVSLWGDEAFSAVLSMNPVPKILEIIARDTSPPLYNLTLHYWYQLFGTGETAIRALSFAYFLLTILFVYKIGALLWNRKTGAITAALAFTNPFFFTYAFEGRMYSILALGVTSSFYFFFRILKGSGEENKRSKKKSSKTPFWLIPAYAVATAWALYSHHFAIFAIFIQAFWLIVEFISGKKSVSKKIFKGLVFAGILYTPWLIPLYRQTKMVGGGFWLGTPTVKDLTNLLQEYLAVGIKNPKIKVSFIPLQDGLAEIAFYLVAITLLFRKWFQGVKKTLILITWFLGPIVLTWLVSQKFQSIFFNRYLLYAIPGAMLILGSNRRKLSGILIGILLVTFIIIDFNYFTHPTKRSFRDLATYVKQTQQSGDMLLNWNSTAHHLWEAKYYGIPAPLYVPEGDLPFYVGTAQMTDKDILREIPDAQRIGVITSGPVDEVIIENYKQESVENFGELKLLWFIKSY